MLLEMAAGAFTYKMISAAFSDRQVSNSTDEKRRISEYRRALIQRRDSVVHESDEDDAASEYQGEIQSIIDVIDCYGTIEEIKKAAEWVGEPCPL